MNRMTLKTISTLFVIAAILVSCNRPSSKDTPASESVSGNDWTILFNGENLDGWYTYQKEPEPTSEVSGLARNEEGIYQEPIGLNEDPLQVFTVVSEEGAPAIRISGEVFGILVTEKEFENYHLSLEFKWGNEKYPPRKNELMDSGILYHSVGSEGAWGGVWMRSLECQVMEEACGDYISVDTVMTDIHAGYDAENGRYYYAPDSAMLTFSPSRSYCKHSQDFANPAGSWNTMEIYALGGESLHVVNGKLNNHVTNSRQLVNGKEVPLTKGKIQLQSEGAEVFYRNIRIRSIEQLPAELLEP
jgi:hypothetical protein